MTTPSDVVGAILDALDDSPPYELLSVLTEHLGRIGAGGVRLWLGDYDESSLEDFVVGGDGHERRPVEAEGPGRSFRAQETVVEDVAPGTVVVCTPVTVRSERLGVLEIRLFQEPDEALVAQLRSVGIAVAYTLLAARRFTDVFELVRRRRDLELPAEMQWELLPVLAHTGPDFTVAGSVEPAYDIGGDNFDYAVDAEKIMLSLTDAMGHGTQAALVSTLAVSAQRNARRHRGSLREQVHAVNRALHDHFEGTVFATGMFLEIHRNSGHAMVVNAGHSLLWRLRGDEVSHVVVPPDVPAGLFVESDYSAHVLDVQEGDRFLLVSDGILEATDRNGVDFGAAGLREVIHATAGIAPVEVVRRLTKAVKDHADTTLGDDATALCVDYRRSS